MRKHRREGLADPACSFLAQLWIVVEIEDSEGRGGAVGKSIYEFQTSAKLNVVSTQPQVRKMLHREGSKSPRKMAHTSI
jgi:hypothetical protein